MPHILIHSLVFSPDGVSTAYLYNDIALKFKESGYKVTVITSTPHYNIIDEEINKQPLKKRFYGLFFESNFQGICVKHIPQKKFSNKILRIIAFIYFHIFGFFLLTFEKKIDIILSPSPPLTIGILNIVIGKIKKVKIIYNVQEIYPDLLIEKGGLKSTLLITFLKWIERIVYNKSDAVTTIDRVFYDTIVNRFKNKSNLHIIPNFVDTEVYKPIFLEPSMLNTTIFPKSDSLKVMYAGNIGIAQDWDILIKVSEELKDQNIDFFVVGEGIMKRYLETQKQSRGLEKLHILPYQARHTIPFLIAYSDLQFIFMSQETEGHGFPSKIYTIMACAKPILVSSGINSPIVNFLHNKNCAYLITDKDQNTRIVNIAKLLTSFSKDELQLKGKSGLSYIETNYSKDHVTKKYVTLANSLLKKYID